MSVTDKKVQDLVKLVKTKKSEISKAEKPDWKTNTSIGINPLNPDSAQRINIQTVTDVKVLVGILAFLNQQSRDFAQAASELGVDVKFTWMGYTLAEWRSDLQARINKVQINEKKKELDALEDRLNKLISPELRAQLELEEITNLLGEK